MVLWSLFCCFRVKSAVITIGNDCLQSAHFLSKLEIVVNILEQWGGRFTCCSFSVSLGRVSTGTVISSNMLEKTVKLIGYPIYWGRGGAFMPPYFLCFVWKLEVCVKWCPRSVPLAPRWLSAICPSVSMGVAGESYPDKTKTTAARCLSDEELWYHLLMRFGGIQDKSQAVEKQLFSGASSGIRCCSTRHPQWRFFCWPMGPWWEEEPPIPWLSLCPMIAGAVWKDIHQKPHRTAAKSWVGALKRSPAPLFGGSLKMAQKQRVFLFFKMNLKTLVLLCRSSTGLWRCEKTELFFF